MLCVLPMFHIFSLNSVLLCSLRAGAGVLIMPKFEIGLMLELIERHRVTVAAVVPPLVLALAKSTMVEKYDLSSIRIVLSGAAPLGKELEQALHRRLPHAVFGQVMFIFFDYLCLSWLLGLFVGGCWFLLFTTCVCVLNSSVWIRNKIYRYIYILFLKYFFLLKKEML